MTTIVSETDLSDFIIDDIGVKYSKDGKRLLCTDGVIFNGIYSIKEGTEVICDHAFEKLRFDNGAYQMVENNLMEIVIPSSVSLIGEKAINGHLKVVCHSEHFIWYKEGLYDHDYKKILYYPFKKEPHKIYLHPSTETISFSYSAEYTVFEGVEGSYDLCEEYPDHVLFQYNPNVKFELPANAILCVPFGTKDKFVNLGYDNTVIVENDVYIDTFGVIYNFDKSQLLRFSCHIDVEEYTIEESCVSISDRAFRRNLTHTGNSIEEIEFETNKLKYLNLPVALRIIGKNAFEGCEFLEKIIITENVKEIDESAFCGCVNICSIKVHASNLHYDSRDNCNAIIEKSENKLITGCCKTIIPSSVSSIGNFAFFRRNNLKRLVVPNGIKCIGNYAFADCASLEKLIMPSTLHSVGEGVFEGCFSLKAIEVNSRIDGFNYECIEECYTLNRIFANDEVFEFYRKLFSYTPFIKILRKTFYLSNNLEFDVKHQVEDDNELKSIIDKLKSNGYVVTNNYIETKYVDIIPAKLRVKDKVSPIECENAVDDILDAFKHDCQVKVIEDKRKLTSKLTGAYFKRIPESECGLVVYSNDDDVLDEVKRLLGKQQFHDVRIVESNSQWAKVDFKTQSIWIKNFSELYSFNTNVRFEVWGDRRAPTYDRKKIEIGLNFTVLKDDEGFDFSGDDISRDPRLW